MQCSVYKSNHKEYTYLYLPQGKVFDDLPAALQGAFGKPEFVIDLELSPDRKLAQADVKRVIKNLRDNGFHLQLPPGDQNGDLI